VNDSRHHGLSISADGEKLCVAGTMDNYATIVDRKTLTAGKLISAGNLIGQREARMVVAV